MTSRTDHRPPRPADTRRRSASSRKSGFGGTLVGIFIGVALGLALAAGVAFYLLKAGNPYARVRARRGRPPREAAKDTSKAGAKRCRPAPRSRVSISTRSCRASRSRRSRPRGRRARRTVPRSIAPPRPTRPWRRWTSVRLRPPDKATKAGGAVLAAGGLLRERGRRREPEGATRVRGLGGGDPVGEPAGQGRALSRPPRPLRQYRRAQPDEGRARQARLRRRGDQVLTALPGRGTRRRARRGDVPGTRVVARSPTSVNQPWRIRTCTRFTH